MGRQTGLLAGLLNAVGITGDIFNICELAVIALGRTFLACSGFKRAKSFMLAISRLDTAHSQLLNFHRIKSVWGEPVKVATIMGSPRRKGNTARVLELFESLLTKNEHKVDRINIVDYKINGCLGCQACQEDMKHEPNCRQDDDAVSIFKRLMAADAVVYASPLYTYSFPAQMKALVDRQNCLVKAYGTPECIALLKGKQTALLVTCGGSVEENADLIQEAFVRESQFQQMKIVGTYVVPNCTTPDALGSRAIEIAKEMARAVVGKE